MISFAARAVRLILRLYTYPYRKHHKSLSRSIKLKNKKYVPPKGYGYSIISAGGVRVEMLSPPHPSGAVIHFHGGGHTAGMNSMYRAMAEKYSKLCGATVFSIDYKTGSNLVYPSVHDEAFKAYEYISRTLSDSPFAVAGKRNFHKNVLLNLSFISKYYFFDYAVARFGNKIARCAVNLHIAAVRVGHVEPA